MSQLGVVRRDAGKGREQDVLSFAALAKGMTLACAPSLDPAHS